jgi:RND superfamily putative drug exporter
LLDALERAAEFLRRYAVVVVAAWIAAAAGATLAVPQLERVVEAQSRAFIPADAASSVAAKRSAQLFGEAPNDNLNYVVLERDKPLTTSDRDFYDRLVMALRDDTEHVHSVTDLWSDPVTEPAARSADGHAVSAMLRLSGMLGTSKAEDAVAAARDTVAKVGPPEGLRVYVTGPGSTIVDEFTAIDRQMLAITAATVALIMLLLLIVYRSPITASIPLLTVGLALAVARPIVAALGDAGTIEVSLFSVALIAAMMLGAGTDYAIFLLGRYHEGLRRGIGSGSALANAYRGVAPVIVGSALTVAAALTCLSLAEVGMFRSTGIPCAIGVLVAMLAALTLTPALIGLAGARGLLRPRRSLIAHRWRRVGVAVARWPGPILVVGVGVLIVAALPLTGLHTGWNEPAATPATAESNRGYQAADRHYADNQLLPDVVTVETDHDIRNPAGLIAVERITRQLMAIPGVRLVQSASRPAGTVPDEATLSGQAGLIGSQLDRGIDALTQQLNRLTGLDAVLGDMIGALDAMSRGLQGSASGLGDVTVAADDMRTGMTGLQTTVTTASGYLEPLRGFIGSRPDCPADPVCALVARVVQPIDDVTRETAQLSTASAHLTDGAATATEALAGVPATIGQMTDTVRQARSATGDLIADAGSVGPQLRQLTDYLREIGTQFHGSAAGGFYLPQRALTDPRLRTALRNLTSTDGRATYLLVYGNGQEWSGDGALRAREIDTAVAEATKEGTLRPTGVHLAGVGPATRDLQTLVRHDMTLLTVTTLALIFLIVTALLRSPVAGLLVVGTVAASYASALGASTLIWQHLLGHELHWAVAPVAFIALVAVGADYNLLLAMRIREEARAGLSTGIIRAFAATGGVVTTAGIVFGITMLALLGSTVLSIAQIGLTIGVGLLIDTLVVRTLVLPATVALLGRWFWWPLRLPTRN